MIIKSLLSTTNYSHLNELLKQVSISIGKAVSSTTSDGSEILDYLNDNNCQLNNIVVIIDILASWPGDNPWLVNFTDQDEVESIFRQALNLIATIRYLYLKVPIIAISPNDKTLEQLCLIAGANDVVVAPVTAQNLIQALNHC